MLTGGTPTASTDAGAGSVASKALDEDEDTVWLSKNDVTGKVPTAPQWWKYDLGVGNSATFVKVDIQSGSFGFYPPPSDFKIQGSNNDSDWDDLKTVSGIPSWGTSEWKTWSFSNSTAYRYLKIDITDSVVTPPDSQVGFAEIEAYE